MTRPTCATASDVYTVASHRAASVYHHLAEHAARRGIEPDRFKRAAREIETAGMRRVMRVVGATVRKEGKRR